MFDPSTAEMFQSEDGLNIRKYLEGPGAIRLLGAAAGAGLVASTGFSLMQFTFTHPATLILKFYEIVFGISLVVVELKDVPKLDSLREFFYRWFPFLTVTQGKGLFYIFTGSLGATFYYNLLLFIPAAVTVGIGFLYLSVYFGQKQQRDEKFERTQMLSRLTIPPA